MLRLLALAALLCAAGAAAAQPRETRDRFLARGCPPGLKYLAGTCVRFCPSGYRNEGRFCRLRQMNR